MVNSFKNFERLRYRLSNDIRQITSDNKETSDNLKEQISNTVFATIFSALITEVVFRDNGTGYDICKILKLVITFVLIYIISYMLYNYLYKQINQKLSERKIYSVTPDMISLIQIQKDFDNIACDSMLMAMDSKKAFQGLENTPENINLKEFFYYEVMHYLDVTCDKTQDLIDNKDCCIRTINEATGVDIFRVINIKNIICELERFLDYEFPNVCKVEQRKETEYQLQELKKKVRNISENCSKIQINL